MSLSWCRLVILLWLGFSTILPGSTAPLPSPAVGQATVDPHYYQYDATALFATNVVPDGTWEGVTRLRVTYPSPVVTLFPVNNIVTAYLFQPSEPGPHPAVIVLHEWLPVNLNNEFNVAAALAKAQIAALVIVQPYSLNRRPMPRDPRGELLTGNVPQMVAGIRQCVLDTRRGLDWLSTRSDIDAGRMGISGISIGGIIAPLVAGVDHRVKAVVAIDGGADVADIVWSSPFLRGLHPEMVQRGYTRTSLRAALAPIESSNWLHGFDPKNGLLFNGRYDVFVTPYHAKELSKAMGGAPIIWLNTGHYGLAFSLKPLYSTGVRFLYSRFSPGTGSFVPPDTLVSHTLKAGFLVGGHEGIYVSPAIAYQIINFDRAGRYSLDGQLSLHGLSGALSARVTTTSSVGLEMPIFHGAVKPKPYLLLHIVL